MATAILTGGGLLTPAATADLLGIKEQTLSVWRSTGRHSLPFVRVGSRVMYRSSDLEKWLADRTATQTR
jgi:predicted site-specific integrase-resolvase